MAAWRVVPPSSRHPRTRNRAGGVLSGMSAPAAHGAPASRMRPRATAPLRCSTPAASALLATSVRAGLLEGADVGGGPLPGWLRDLLVFLVRERRAVPALGGGAGSGRAFRPLLRASRRTP